MNQRSSFIRTLGFVLPLLVAGCGETTVTDLDTTCPTGETVCDDACVDTMSDSAHCGECNNACRIEHAIPACVEGNCVLDSCEDGFRDCDADPANGCEIDTGLDEKNCGDCGNECAPGEICSGDGVCTLVCPPNQVACSGDCIDPKTERRFCGASADCLGENQGRTCAPGEYCADGVCSTMCPLELCGDLCIDTRFDPRHCGKCNARCELDDANAACVDGKCVIAACREGFGDCDGDPLNGCETDIHASQRHCGSCGNACQAGEVCNELGVCKLTCQKGLIDCGGVCTDPSIDREFCGASDDCLGENAGTLCAADEFCLDGVCTQFVCTLDLCGDLCVDTDFDPDHCGGCDQPCELDNSTAACLNGECAIVKCRRGFMDCDEDPLNGCEVHAAYDGKNCGACGLECEPGQICELTCQSDLVACGGACVNPDTNADFCGASGDCEGDNAGERCALGQYCSQGECAWVNCPLDLCGLECVDLEFDPTNCGQCDKTCVFDNAVPACVDRECVIGTCLPPYRNCDNDSANGCEADTETDESNCGSCGYECPSTHSCCDAVCIPSTADNENCGGCGAACSPGQSCSGGECRIQKLVFLTSEKYTGDLGGLTGADAKCQELASAAGLLGTYRAWLSDTTGSPSTRFTRSDIEYRRPDGALVANDWDDLVDGILENPINVHEDGTLNTRISGCFDDSVYTHTYNSGLPLTGSPCSDWTTTSYDGVSSTVGYIHQTSGWSHSCSGGTGCSTERYLYCFQQ
jgi:hypothetical protein